MGVDMKQFVKDRNNAFAAFVLNDDWAPVIEYCHTYSVPMPDNPDVMAAGIYKAVQHVTNMPDDVKAKAAMKCVKLGFSPFMNTLDSKEDQHATAGENHGDHLLHDRHGYRRDK